MIGASSRLAQPVAPGALEAGSWVVGGGWITRCNATSAAGGLDDGTRRRRPLRSARPAVPIGGESMALDADHPIGTLGRRLNTLAARWSRCRPSSPVFLVPSPPLLLWSAATCRRFGSGSGNRPCVLRRRTVWAGPRESGDKSSNPTKRTMQIHTLRAAAVAVPLVALSIEPLIFPPYIECPLARPPRTRSPSPLSSPAPRAVPQRGEGRGAGDGAVFA